MDATARRRGRAVGVGLPLGVEPCGPEVGVRHRGDPHAGGFRCQRRCGQEREHRQQGQKQRYDPLFHKALSGRERQGQPTRKAAAVPSSHGLKIDFE